MTEVCSADLAGVRLLACVDQHMGTEMGHLERKARYCYCGLKVPLYGSDAMDNDKQFCNQIKKIKVTLLLSKLLYSHLDKAGTTRLTLVRLFS